MKNKGVIIFSLFITCLILISSCQNEASLDYQRYYTVGKKVYDQHCQNCHGKQGEGLANLMPPLTDTVYLKENKRKIACFIKNGLSGPVIVQNKLYDGKMPSEAHLSNIEIAQVITYITNSFGNKQGLHDLDMVTEDLKQCK